MNFVTELTEGLAIAWGAIRANQLRSVLTTLGIVIGIITVTLMGTAIEGLNRSFLNSISSIGADVLYAGRQEWFIESYQQWLAVQKRPRFTETELNALQNEMTLAAAIAPVAQSSAAVTFGRHHTGSAPVVGTTDQYLVTSGDTLAAGRFLSAADCDGGRPVCVIGAELVTNLFPRGAALGAKILVNHRSYEVVGTLEKQGGFASGGGADKQVIIPLLQYETAFDENPDLTLEIKAHNLGALEDAREELRALLRRVRQVAPDQPDNFAINQQDQFIELFHRVAGTIEAIGLFITGLSLFVGGIGIMNIMFVSVAERTREIGVRKAIGARNRTILLQFLVEAACICVMGGLIALLIAWPTTLLLQRIMPAVLSPGIVGLALLVSALTGVLSGLLPAWRAARMNPVDALRNE